MKDFDCVVVGGGMIGSSAALSLAELGLRVALIERSATNNYNNESPYELRVSAISLGSEFLLSQLDVWRHIKAQRTVPYSRLGVWEQDIAYAEFSAEDIQQSHLGHIVENKLIQHALWRKLDVHPKVAIFNPQEIDAMVHEDNRVILALNKQNISARMVIAADGARSKVREMAGIGVTGWQYSQSAMLMHVETELPQQSITWQQFCPSGPVAMLPLAGNQASLVWYHNESEIKRLASLSNEALSQEVQAFFPKRLGRIKVINKGYFPLVRQHANSYIANNVVLLGDAAHSINPLAGQGANMGFKDVQALRQVISEAIAENENWYSAPVLRRYQSKRRGDNQMMMAVMDAFYCTFSNDRLPLKFMRNFGLFIANRVGRVKHHALAYACGL